MVIPDNTMKCHALPLNQETKEDYDRWIGPYDVVFTIEEYGRIQKYVRQLENKCGGN